MHLAEDNVTMWDYFKSGRFSNMELDLDKCITSDADSVALVESQLILLEEKVGAISCQKEGFNKMSQHSQACKPWPMFAVRSSNHAIAWAINQHEYVYHLRAG